MRGFTEMSDDQVAGWLRAHGVQIDGRKIPTGSYGLNVWAAIDCLLNHHKGYSLTTGG
jgi:hypothetical protein